MRDSSFSWHLIIHWVLSESLLCVLPFTSAMPGPARSPLSFPIWFITELPDRSFFLLTFAFLVHSLHDVKKKRKRKKKLYSHLPLPTQKSSVTCTLAWHLSVESLPGPSRTAFQLVLGARIYLQFPNLPLYWVWNVPFCSSHSGAQPWSSSPAQKWFFSHLPPLGRKSVLQHCIDFYL